MIKLSQNCMLCLKQFSSINGLAKHIVTAHPDYTKKSYYDKFINATKHLCICGSQKRFRNLQEGYRTYCSIKCCHKHKQAASFWTNKKQPQAMIDKRRATMLRKYGVNNGFSCRFDKASNYKGFVCRSSYEKIFIDFAEQYGYTLKMSTTIQYNFDGRNRIYHPDFYIVELEMIIEIKSNWTWEQNLLMNIAKLEAVAQAGYKIMEISEEHGLLQDWNLLNFHISNQIS